MASSFPFDVANQCLYKATLRGAAALTTDTDGTAVDMLETEGPVTLIVNGGNLTLVDEEYDFIVKESDTSGGSYTAVTGATVSLTADDQDVAVTFDNRSKRWLRVSLDVTGSNPSFLGSALFLARKKITGTGDGAYVGF